MDKEYKRSIMDSKKTAIKFAIFVATIGFFIGFGLMNMICNFRA